MTIRLANTTAVGTTPPGIGVGLAPVELAFFGVPYMDPLFAFRPFFGAPIFVAQDLSVSSDVPCRSIDP